MKFTQGNWFVVEHKERGFGFPGVSVVAVNPKSGPTIASLPLAKMTEHNIDANARLIAAAPEMFEALERIIKYNGSTGGAEALVKEFKFIAQQAVAKARGEK